MRHNDTSGVMAIEACISLTLFMIIMYALYSMVTLFSAQSIIGHALSESCQSLALENYSASKSDGAWSVSQLPASLVRLFSTSPERDDLFTNDENIGKADDTTVQNLSKTRFAAFLGGDVENADTILRALGVQGGLDGMDFSKTAVKGSDLTMSVTYKIALLIRADAFHLGVYTTTQSVCSRLWGSAD